MTFRSLLLGFINDYDKAFHQFYSQGSFPHDVHQNMIRLRDYVKSFAQAIDSNYRVKISQGAPNWTKNPWLGIRDIRITNSFTKGVYIVYLLNKDSKDLYLAIIQGATEAYYYGNDNIPFTGISGSTSPKTLRKLNMVET